MQKVPQLSVVIPVLNESQNVAGLHREIVAALRKTKKSYEIIFIDDGSTDNTLNELEKLSPVKIIQFRKNFGQSAALDAGIKEAKGQIIVTLDGDGQNDPRDIPSLLSKLKEVDCVCGWRCHRKDNRSKRIISKGANFIGRLLINPQVHDSGCTLRAYKKECFEELDLYGEMHRIVPALLGWQGYKVGELRVNHRPRRYGKSKYNGKRVVKGLLDMACLWFWRKFSLRPLHLFGAMGIICLAGGIGLLGFLMVAKLFLSYSLSDKVWPLVGFFLVLSGIQLLVSGVLADIAIKNYYKDRKTYRISNIYETI